MQGVMQTRDAQRHAQSLGLDLVEVSPNADPPVCKIMDYGKFRYDEGIKRKLARKNQKTTHVKEIKFHASVDKNDLETKLRKIRGFLEAGHKVKVTLQYRGRENAHKELGMEVVQGVIAELGEEAVVEQHPRIMGRMLGCLLSPKPAKSVQGGKKGGQRQQDRPSSKPVEKPKPAAAESRPAPESTPVAQSAPVQEESAAVQDSKPE
jgi:translation initiation factor IF-3